MMFSHNVITFEASKARVVESLLGHGFHWIGVTRASDPPAPCGFSFVLPFRTEKFNYAALINYPQEVFFSEVPSRTLAR